MPQNPQPWSSWASLTQVEPGELNWNSAMLSPEAACPYGSKCFLPCKAGFFTLEYANACVSIIQAWGFSEIMLTENNLVYPNLHAQQLLQKIYAKLSAGQKEQKDQSEPKEIKESRLYGF